MSFVRAAVFAVVLVSPFAAAPAGAQAAIPLFLDDFECSSTVRWSQTSGGAPLDLPPAGVFEPAVECEWDSVPAEDPFPAHLNVLPTPMFADLPYGAPGSVEIVAMAYNFNDGGSQSCQGTDPSYFGVLRILDGATCALITTVADASHPMIAAAPPALGDLDGDGFVDIVALENGMEVVAFRWDEKSVGYQFYWSATDTDLAERCRWDGVSLHDLDDDGLPEVIWGHQVYDGTTGARRDDGTDLATGSLSVPLVANVDGDPAPELVGEKLLEWDDLNGQWDDESGATGAGSTAIADFDADGTPEIGRGTGLSTTLLEDLSGTPLFSVATTGGGPPAIADFDADGRPEMASGAGSFVRVFDLDCAGTPAGCAEEYVRWKMAIQDLSSRRSTTVAFDFDLDGESEVVFADECFLRVFDGSDGGVLASVARKSCTWIEGPTIGDVDGDGSAEVVIGSNANCAISCPALDPIHRGARCSAGSDCLSGTCDAGYCRCTGDEHCSSGAACATPLAETPGTGDVCRAAHEDSYQGIRVVGDAFDRWGPARAIWNQAVYDVTNVEDDGTIPSTSERLPNYLVPFRNDFRAQESLCAPKP